MKPSASDASSKSKKVPNVPQAPGRTTVLTMMVLLASATGACSSSSSGGDAGSESSSSSSSNASTGSSSSASSTSRASSGDSTGHASSSGSSAQAGDAGHGSDGGDAGHGSDASDAGHGSDAGDAGPCTSASCADGGPFYTAAAFFRGPLAASVASSETTSNMFFMGVEAEAQGAGDDGHQSLLGTTDLGTTQNQFVGLDTWISDAEMNAVYSAAPVQAFAASFYSAAPEFETFYLTNFYQWGNTHSAESSSPFYVVVVRGLYNAAPAGIKPIHDSIAQGAEAEYKAAGNVAHIVWSGRTNPLEALIVDVWTSDANINSFYSTAFQTSLATLFDSTGPNYGVYSSTDWATW
jgi:hypothetical protein